MGHSSKANRAKTKAGQRYIAFDLLFSLVPPGGFEPSTPALGVFDPV